MSEDTSTPAASSESSSPAPSAKSEKVNISVGGTGGSFSFDEFQRATGQESDNVDDSDSGEEGYGEEDGYGELLDDPAEATDKAIIEDSGEEDEGEEAEEETEELDPNESEALQALQELSANTRKGLKAVTKDGTEINLPADLEIIHMVDGEPIKINLKEHIGMVAGELAVKNRLGKIMSFREDVERRRVEVEKVHADFMGKVNTMVEYAKQGRPDLAICFLAELNGMSPIQMKRHFLGHLVAEANKFEGKSEVEVENYYLALENKWRGDRELKAKELTEKQTKANQFIDHVTQELRKENISPDEFAVASKTLAQNGELKGLSQDASLDRVIEHALATKHEGMAQQAIRSVNPKLVNNQKLMSLLLEYTHPNKFTVQEMAKVLREYLGDTTTRIASSLSKKAQPGRVGNISEKRNEAGKNKTYRSQADLAKAFGLY